LKWWDVSVRTVILYYILCVKIIWCRINHCKVS
jgi:hypothetical protein